MYNDCDSLTISHKIIRLTNYDNKSNLIILLIDYYIYNCHKVSFAYFDARLKVYDAQ